MANFRLSHRHTSQECRAAFACWRGFASPLRHHPTTGSCHIDDHQLWWDVQADNADAALALLPPFIAQRTKATPTGQVPIP
ncbi:hypothetical protein MXD62_07515 [Frankia sp. Mgl5]|nr:hypothetical protein [Frankia sp. Mgl5]